MFYFRWHALKLAAGTSKHLQKLIFEIKCSQHLFQMHLPIQKQSCSTSVVYTSTFPPVFVGIGTPKKEKHHPHSIHTTNPKINPPSPKINIFLFCGYRKQKTHQPPLVCQTNEPNQTMATQQIIGIQGYLTEEKIPEKPLIDCWWFRNPKQPTTWDGAIKPCK